CGGGGSMRKNKCCAMGRAWAITNNNLNWDPSRVPARSWAAAVAVHGQPVIVH
ncbi:hypothetical protein J6590_016458, partial [Homalodisca vitripennis]